VDGLGVARALMMTRSAAVMCPAYSTQPMAAGPDEVRGPPPKHSLALIGAVAPWVSPAPGLDRFVIVSQRLASAPAAQVPGTACGSVIRRGSPDRSYSAKARPRRSARSCSRAPRRRLSVSSIQAGAPASHEARGHCATIGSPRSRQPQGGVGCSHPPCFVIPACRSRPPLLLARGVSPSQAANCRLDRKTPISDTVAAIALAVMAPMPGMLASRRLLSQARWRVSISASRRSTYASIVRSWSRGCAAAGSGCPAGRPM
jgi:hypothetical protein